MNSKKQSNTCPTSAKLVSKDATDDQVAFAMKQQDHNLK